MTTEQVEKRVERAANEAMIISLNESGGFKVYSPAYPTKIYTVDGSSDGPTCTCPDFQLHRADPEWECKHVLAVKNLVNSSQPAQIKSDHRETDDKPVAISENQPSKKDDASVRSHAVSQMLIKRSVSPDGRIDSLSIEISFPFENYSKDEVKAGAERTLEILSEIIDDFMDENGKDKAQPNGKDAVADGSVPAQMINVGGMRGKWGGRRLFINVDVNGQTLKLFGSGKELAEHIVAAGFPDLSERIAEGAVLNLPCRVTTKPSSDGRYTNVERVLPIEALRPTRRPVK